MDIMWLDGKAVLHMVDKDTKFSAAAFLPSETADATWNTYIRNWVAPYIGHALEIHADQGPQFRSKRFVSNANTSGVKLRLSGVESHNSLGVGERYHHYLRRIFTKVQDEHPRLSPGDVLTLATRAMNDTAGPKGRVPTLLVFGVMPRIPIQSDNLPGQIERMQAMQSARRELSKDPFTQPLSSNLEIAGQRLSTAMKSKVPSATDVELDIGSEVLLYKEKPTNKWAGPFRVLDVKDKVVWIDIDGRISQLSVDKVKPYLREHAVSPPSQNTHGETGAPSENTIQNLSPTPAYRRPETECDPLHDLFKSRANADTLLREEFLVTSDVFMTQIIEPSDPRANSEVFTTAKKREVEGLERRGVWKKVFKNSLPPRPNMLGGRVVLTLKKAGTSSETPKARFVAQGFSDRNKDFIIHNVTSLRQSSVRIIVSFAASNGYRIFSHDVTQEYIQSDENLTRELYLQPKPTDSALFSLGTEEILKLLKPIYGMTDAGDYWNVTVDRHARHDLGMQAVTGDPSLYFKFTYRHKRADGLMGMLVDDGLLCGTKQFEALTEFTLQRFESRPRE